jgi:hypothetical protein
MKRIVLVVLVICLCAITWKCAVPFQGGPSKEEMDKADYGPVPTDCETAIKKWMKDNSKDLSSAQLKNIGIGQPEKSWWGQTGALLSQRVINYGWRVTVSVNVSDSEYIRWKVYSFFFRDGEIKYTDFEK